MKITPKYQVQGIFNCFVVKAELSTAQQKPSGASGGKAAP